MDRNPPLSFGDLFGVSAERSGDRRLYLEGPSPPPSRATRPKSSLVGDMVETLVALSGAIGSGHRHLSQAADAVLDQAVAASGKPGVVWGYRHPSNRGNLEAESDTTRPNDVKAKVGSEK